MKILLRKTWVYELRIRNQWYALIFLEKGDVLQPAEAVAVQSLSGIPCTVRSFGSAVWYNEPMSHIMPCSTMVCNVRCFDPLCCAVLTDFHAALWFCGYFWWFLCSINQANEVIIFPSFYHWGMHLKLLESPDWGVYSYVTP